MNTDCLDILYKTSEHLRACMHYTAHSFDSIHNHAFNSADARTQECTETHTTFDEAMYIGKITQFVPMRWYKNMKFTYSSALTHIRTRDLKNEATAYVMHIHHISYY